MFSVVTSVMMALQLKDPLPQATGPLLQLMCQTRCQPRARLCSKSAQEAE